MNATRTAYARRSGHKPLPLTDAQTRVYDYLRSGGVLLVSTDYWQRTPDGDTLAPKTTLRAMAHRGIVQAVGERWTLTRDSEAFSG